MSLSPFGVRVSAGSLRAPEGLVLPHAWTDEGVVTSPVGNGAQVLHLSVALCILNDTFREAARLGVVVDGVAVEADGGFDEDWRSTGIGYVVTLDSRGPVHAVDHLLEVVDAVAEVPRAIRAGAEVSRVSELGV